jgi:crotonobetainyl-CoA:carnitine CoA-transferase CaiB-like acyl-CoA transferase
MTEKGHAPMAGDITVVAQANNIEGVEKNIRLPPPALGEHTDEILKTLSLSDETIARLRARNVI